MGPTEVKVNGQGGRETTSYWEPAVSDTNIPESCPSRTLKCRGDPVGEELLTTHDLIFIRSKKRELTL